MIGLIPGQSVGAEHRVRLLSASTARPVPSRWPGRYVQGSMCSMSAPTASPNRCPIFLSHPMPAEVVTRDERAGLIRPRLGRDTWLGQQVLPDLGVRS